MTIKKPKPTRADLQRQIVELQAQLASTYHFADQGLDKAGQDKLMGSGVVITMHALGGREIIPPVCIRDGLSDKTISLLRDDLAASYKLAIAFKPSFA